MMRTATPPATPPPIAAPLLLELLFALVGAADVVEEVEEEVVEEEEVVVEAGALVRVGEEGGSDANAPWPVNTRLVTGYAKKELVKRLQGEGSKNVRWEFLSPSSPPM